MPKIDGFLKMPKSEFDTFNADALAWLQNDNRERTGEEDLSIDTYTTYTSDASPLYCWARVEEEYTSRGLTDTQRNNIKTSSEAVALGMIIPTE